jgi:predicted transcriptional regulator YdeE
MTTQTEPKIVEKTAFRVAGIRYEGKNEHGEIPAMWDNQFLPRMGELDNIRVGGTYGIARSMPGVEVSHGFEYLAGMEVAAGAPLPSGMIAWEIPTLTYAVLPAHDVPGIGPVCDFFYQEWLPKSPEWEMGEGLMMEYYPETYPQDLIIYLHFPIKRKGT